MKQLARPLVILAFVIIISAAIVRIYSSGETLADYAQENPAIAYATPDISSKPTVTPVPVTPTTDGATDGRPSADPLVPSGDSPVTAAAPKQDALVSPTPGMSGSGQAASSAYSALPGKVPADREIYQPDFYKEPLNERLIAYITGISYPVTAAEAEAVYSSKTLPGGTGIVPAVNIIADEASIAISYEQLCYLSILYYDFDGEVQTGELICNVAIADDLLEIFYELYLSQYPIEKIRLIEEYNGDDTLSMLDNNTSSFNYRLVDGSTNLSKHALGLAIDINPFYNPYVVYRKDGTTYISPEGSELYTDRSQDFPYKIDENDLCYQLFTEHGFTWGGSWNTMKDYQHFHKA